MFPDRHLGILETHLQENAFAIGAKPSIADISMMAYLHYPADETGYDFAVSHAAVSAWLGRMASLPGWKSAYDLLPGKRLTHYAK
jgi:glutathione S-transferase